MMTAKTNSAGPLHLYFPGPFQIVTCVYVVEMKLEPSTA